MVILDREEYCFLYDRHSFPELLESLLDYGEDIDEMNGNASTGLTSDQAREVARGLIGHVYQEL